MSAVLRELVQSFLTFLERVGLLARFGLQLMLLTPRALLRPRPIIEQVYNTGALSLVIIMNGEQFRLDHGDILHYERQLDLRDGVLSRLVRWRSPTGKTVELRFERFASLADPHVLGLRCQITPIDFNGTIAVQSNLNGYPENQGFDHWEQLDSVSERLRPQGTLEQGRLEQGLEPEIWLQVRTRSSHIELGMAAKIAVIGINASLL